MAPQIVVFGATGYTGELVSRALVSQGASPVLAARNGDRVAALALQLGGLEHRVADVADPASVRALVERGDVLLSCVGPFARWGEPAVLAAIGAGAHYIDSTGEPPFIRSVFERYGPQAAGAGCGLVTAFGYDWVPGNLAGALALREAGDTATRVVVGYFIVGGRSGPSDMSGGTLASLAGAVLEPHFAFRGGRVVSERSAARVRSFETAPNRRASAISVGSSEHFALPRLHPALRDVDAYLGWFGPLSRPMQAMSAATSLATKLPGVSGLLTRTTARLAKGSSGGPDATARARSRSLILAEAYDAAGTRLSQVRLEGVNGYTFTGDILAWGARAALAGGLQGTGALGPADAFGLEALEQGVAAAGIARR